MELLKSLIAWAISPVILCLLLQVPGWILCLTRRKRPGLVLVGLGTLVLLIGSIPIVSFEANRKREGEHPPLMAPGGADPSTPALVVVLGASFHPDPRLPANSRVGTTFLARLLEGVRVVRARPNARLLVSIANIDADPADKRKFLDAMSEVLVLDRNRVEILTEAESTADEARLAAERHHKGEQVVVVTSAGHMPRAIKLFTEAGLSPVASPCDYRYRPAGGPDDSDWKRWIPSGEGPAATQQLLYELLAGFTR